MLWKLLLTLAVLLGGWFFVKARLRGPEGPPAWSGAQRARLPHGAMRHLAFAVVGVMLLGSGWYLYRGWARGNEVLEVQVVNALTGAVTPYQARRRDIDGRVFRTLDGREIRLADVERMILLHAGQRL